MAMALQQLRQAIIAKQNITVDDDSIILNDGAATLPRKLATNFRSLHGRGEPYLLETVYFQYKFREYPYNEYFQSCKEKGVGHAFLIDKKDLLAYIGGEIDTCASITADQSAPSDQQAATDSAPPTEQPPASKPDSARETTAPTRPAPSADGSERSRKRDRDQRVLDATFTAIEWDFSMMRDKLAAHLASMTKAQAADQKKKPGYDPRGDRYANNEGRVWRENLGSDFNEMDIDMSGSFKAKPKATSANGKPSSEKPSVRPRSNSQGHQSEQARKRMKLDPQQRVPIIIVPSGDTTLISAMNALEFMKDGHLLTSDEMRKREIPIAQPARKALRRKPGGNCSQADYLVVSNPNRLTPKEWDQVVAVICSGQSWQFSKWPIYDGTPADLLRKVQGFYFHFDDSPPVGDVKEWPVKMMALSRERRHTDGGLAVQFWASVDNFIGRKKTHLRY